MPHKESSFFSQQSSRRDFLKTGGKAAFGLTALVSELAACAPKGIIAGLEKLDQLTQEQEIDAETRQDLREKFPWFTQYETFEQEIEKHRILEKIARLKKKYSKELTLFMIASGVADSETIYSVLKEKVTSYANARKTGALNAETIASYDEEFSRFGPLLTEVVNQYWIFDPEERKKELQQQEPQETRLVGFEKTNISPDILRKLLTAYYPLNFLKTHVAEIRWFPYDDIKNNPNRVITREREGRGEISVPKTATADVIKNLVQSKKTINVYATGERKFDTYQSLLEEVLNHEFGHAASFTFSPLLNSFDKVDLLTQVDERVTDGSKNRTLYSSPVVDQQLENTESNYMKLEEYFAHIHQAYFNNPSEFQRKYLLDFAIIDETVRHIDPDFNPFESFKRREEQLKRLRK